MHISIHGSSRICVRTLARASVRVRFGFAVVVALSDYAVNRVASRRCKHVCVCVCVCLLLMIFKCWWIYALRRAAPTVSRRSPAARTHARGNSRGLSRRARVPRRAGSTVKISKHPHVVDRNRIQILFLGVYMCAHSSLARLCSKPFPPRVSELQRT